VSISAAKALAYAWAVPVKGVSSLAAWALALPAGSRVVVTSERRGPAFYLALYYVGADHVVPIVPDTAISGALPNIFPIAEPIQVVGPAVDDPELLAALGPLAVPASWNLSGSEVARLAWPGLQWGRGDDVFALRPSYLRPAAISRPAR
jgi:tRNA A37 threonylcarbamoyladenosine modification protein TsaB